MNNEERTLTIEELKRLKEELINDDNINNNNSSLDNSYNISKQKKIGIGSITGGLNMYPEYEEKKSGFVNIISLSLLTLFFECLFIFIAVNIWK